MKDNYEKELEKRRAELKNMLYNDEKQTRTNYTSTNKPKKNIFTRIIMSISVVCALAFLIYMILDSTDKINQLYQIINSFIIFLLVIFISIYYKTRKNGIQIINCLLLMILMGFNVLVNTNILTLPTQKTVTDFTNKSLTSGIKWAENNNIKYDQTFEYSDTIKKYNVIAQNKKENTLLKNISSIDFIVSKGPDYNKEIILSDMSGWNIDDAVSIIKENLLNNVTVNFEENTDVKKDTIISQSKTGKMKRNDTLIFTVSLGSKDSIKQVKMKNLTNKSLFDACLFLNRNLITYEIKYEFSNKIDKGNIINTSVKKGTTVKPNDKIILTVSKGKKITVKDFTNKSLSQATKWAILNNLNIDYSDEYNDKVKQGNIISMTYKQGDVIEEDSTIKFVVSKGKLKMPKFDSLASFKAWADTYKVKYEVKEEFDDNKAQGDIIKFSVQTGETIKDNITVYVSKGKAIKVPDFSGKTKSTIQKECDSLGIICSFSSEYNTKVSNNTIISQSIKKGEKIAKGDTINIVLATNKKENVTKTTSSSNKIYTSSNKQNSSNNTSNNNSNNIVNCKNYTFNLGAGATGSQTKQIISGLNPNLKFSWNAVSSCSSGDKEPGTICSTSVSDGASVSSCTTITVTYVN